MSATLVIWCERDRLGELSTDCGIWQFRYDPSWLAHERRYPLSPHFPLRAEPFVDTSSDERPVQWFFDNLLPEGGVRQALAQLARLAANDGFGLLARFGEESAGALTLLPTEAPPPAQGRYEPLSLDELRELIRKRPGIPLIAAAGRAKMSLAGAQHKLPLHWDGAQFRLPQGAPSTHILKPENARPERYPFCPANEHFCMSLARSIGLPAPDTELMHLPEPAYLVRRCDRVTADRQTRRLHQIDLCQLLNKWPEYKYETQGGATFREAYLALAQTRQPAPARRQLLRWLVFNYLIGNSDAHAKNISFLVDPKGLSLAPFYDLLCATVYGDDTMAMTLGGDTRYGWVTSNIWDEVARDLGLRPAYLRRLRLELAKDLPRAVPEILARAEFTGEEGQFLAKVAATVDEHARFVLEGLHGA